MTSHRLPAVLLSLTAAGFLVWAVVLLTSPGGARALEWIQLVVAAGLLGYGVKAYLKPTPQDARRIRWILVAATVLGVVVVIGLAADDNSTRTWARLGWAALITGFIASLIAWWNAPGVSRNIVITGGVVGAVLIAAGVGITTNCDDNLQRSWCDPLYEEEQALVEQITVNGDLQRRGRAGGDNGAALMAYVVTGGSILDNTRPPLEFVYEARPIQSIEEERGRYTTESGRHAHCHIDVKIEDIPAGTIQTVMVTCRPAADI